MSGVHTVKKGESLWSIAQSDLGEALHWPEIAKKNSLKAPYWIFVGQSLKLPTRFRQNTLSYGFSSATPPNSSSAFPSSNPSFSASSSNPGTGQQPSTAPASAPLVASHSLAREKAKKIQLPCVKVTPKAADDIIKAVLKRATGSEDGKVILEQIVNCAPVPQKLETSLKLKISGDIQPAYCIEGLEVSLGADKLELKAKQEAAQAFGHFVHEFVSGFDIKFSAEDIKNALVNRGSGVSPEVSVKFGQSFSSIYFGKIKCEVRATALNKFEVAGSIEKDVKMVFDSYAINVSVGVEIKTELSVLGQDEIMMCMGRALAVLRSVSYAVFKTLYEYRYVILCVVGLIILWEAAPLVIIFAGEGTVTFLMAARFLQTVGAR